jgi:hypothetical protein
MVTDAERTLWTSAIISALAADEISELAQSDRPMANPVFLFDGHLCE